MERLDHEHVVKLVGTYSIRYNELYLLVWPVAVCDLSSFLDDVDALRSGHGDREDIYRRFEALDLQTHDGSRGPPGALDHNTLLFQSMGCIMRATAHCHHVNVRHLDLKPSNILLGPGRVYLADFGIAKDVEERDSTRTVGRVGTIKWQASEVTNSCTDKDEWSMKAADVFALGLVLVNIAAVLFRSNLAELDQILSDMDPETRAEGLARYQGSLAQLALATQDFRPPDERTVAPRHILGLTARMTSPDPKMRPSADSVDRELVELGGLEQVYHSPCCKKGVKYLTKLIDAREEERSRQLQKLHEDNARQAKKIEVLENRDVTYEERLQKEAEKNAKSVANLDRLLELERTQRLRLEAQLRYLGRPRPGVTKGEVASKPGSQLRNYGKPQTHNASTAARTLNPLGLNGAEPPTAPRSMLPSPPVRPAATTVQPPQDPHTRPGISFAGAASAGVPPRDHSSTSPLPGLMTRRSMSNSKLPLAINPARNPATPIRSRTNTPNLNRDLSLTDSTQNSMTSSTLSRFSIGTQETSADPSPAIGSNSPLLQKNAAAAASNNELAAVSAVGLGILNDSVARHIGDADDVRHAVAAGALSPVPASSTMSSPRTTKSELASEHSFRSMARVPGLFSERSWAEVARKDKMLRA